MRVRTPALDPVDPTGPVDSDDPGDQAGRVNASDDHKPAGPVAFRVAGEVIAVKLGLTLVLTLLAVAAGDSTALVLGLAAAAGLLGYATRDLVSRCRLRADATGVEIVTGYAHRRRLDWDSLVQVRVATLPRLGATTRLLELDSGDEIFLFSRYDLGGEPDAAARALARLRPGGSAGQNANGTD
jgi:hypothetical protein